MRGALLQYTETRAMRAVLILRGIRTSLEGVAEGVPPILLSWGVSTRCHVECLVYTFRTLQVVVK